MLLGADFLQKCLSPQVGRYLQPGLDPNPRYLRPNIFATPQPCLARVTSAKTPPPWARRLWYTFQAQAPHRVHLVVHVPGQTNYLLLFWRPPVGPVRSLLGVLSTRSEDGYLRYPSSDLLLSIRGRLHEKGVCWRRRDGGRDAGVIFGNGGIFLLGRNLPGGRGSLFGYNLYVWSILMSGAIYRKPVDK